jgi:hypothetical protein
MVNDDDIYNERVGRCSSRHSSPNRAALYRQSEYAAIHRDRAPNVADPIDKTKFRLKQSTLDLVFRGRFWAAILIKFVEA